MKKWFVPTWSGDLRLEPLSGDDKKTKLTIEKPTPDEKNQIIAFSALLVDRGWLEEPLKDIGSDETWAAIINAPLEKVGPVFVNVLRPGPAVMTAVKFKDGHIEVCEHRETGATGKELAKLAEKPKAETAVTVKRPTPCCPDCYVGAIAPATEVLLSFLTPEQHATWKKGRYIVVRGGLSGHRYIIAHRNSEIAAKNGKIAWDCEDRDVIHFHDWSVPPEEEVLAAMLILQYREPWLRNEATCYSHWGTWTKVFKNPFGDETDGIPDATLTTAFGAWAEITLG